MARRFAATLRALAETVSELEEALWDKRDGSLQLAFILREKLVEAINVIDDRIGESTCGAAVYWHGDQSYSADGHNPLEVSNREHLVLQYFLNENRAHGTHEFRNYVTNIAEVMASLRRKFGDAVRLPTRKGKGRGYYVRVYDREFLNSARSLYVQRFLHIGYMSDIAGGRRPCTKECSRPRI